MVMLLYYPIYAINSPGAKVWCISLLVDAGIDRQFAGAGVEAA